MPDTEKFMYLASRLLYVSFVGQYALIYSQLAIILIYICYKCTSVNQV